MKTNIKDIVANAAGVALMAALGAVFAYAAVYAPAQRNAEAEYIDATVGKEVR